MAPKTKKNVIPASTDVLSDTLIKMKSRPPIRTMKASAVTTLAGQPRSPNDFWARWAAISPRMQPATTNTAHLSGDVGNQLLTQNMSTRNDGKALKMDYVSRARPRSADEYTCSNYILNRTVRASSTQHQPNAMGLQNRCFEHAYHAQTQSG